MPIDALIVIRKDCFYFMAGAPEGIPLKKWAEDNACLNPGTLKIETLSGEVLWQQQ